MYHAVLFDYDAMLRAICAIKPGERVLVSADPHVWYSPMYREYEAARTLLQAAHDVVATDRGMLFLKRQGGLAHDSYVSHVLIGTQPGTRASLDQALERYWAHCQASNGT